MPRPYTPPPRDTRPRLPSAPGPKPAVISRADTIIELRTIYRLIDQELYAAAKSKLILLGRNLQH
jgi:hypothetical protein